MSGVRFPAGFRHEPLRRDHPRRRFRSGQAQVDDWLATKSLKHQDKHLSVTKVLLDEAGAIAGCYTLATGQVDFGDRPKREDLMRAARRREINLILVWRLDRWGRSLVDLVTTLQELTALQVGFVSLSEALDLTTPSGRALAGMLAVFAEFERD